MGFFSFFSKEKKETLDKGLSKTKESVFGKIARAVAGKSKVDDEVLDNLEEVLITSDVGVETTLNIIKRIEKRAASDKYVNTQELNTILRDEMPELKIRVVNVVDLFKMESDHKHPHGLSDAEYDAIFTKDKPIIFAFHGYPTLIHELTYERNNHNISVHGYQEEGTITTPFDMRVQNQIDRFNLVKDAIMHLPQLGNKGSFLIQKMNDKLVEHKQYIAEYGQDLEEIRNWEWHK